VSVAAADPVAALALSALHSDLSNAERAALAGQILILDYPSGALIFDQNDIGDGAYVVLKGRVKTAKRLPGGKAVDVADHGVGALFGELALAGRGVLRTANATASEPSRLLFIPLDAFHASLRQPGDTAVKLLAKLDALITARLSATLGEIPLSGETRLRNGKPHLGSDFPVRDFLTKLPCCAELGEAGCDWLMAESETVTAATGTPVDDAVYLIVRGAVRASKGDQQMEVRGPGRFCGPDGATGLRFTTSEGTTLLRFATETFDSISRGGEANNRLLAQAYIADKVQALSAANAVRARDAALDGL
jgi:CRP/FNR family transcriptional regulator, cyclic AMP receptor protein